jgi:hypothetical protein
VPEIWGQLYVEIDPDDGITIYAAIADGKRVMIHVDPDFSICWDYDGESKVKDSGYRKYCWYGTGSR